MHVAVVGTGRVGRATLGLLVSEAWISKLTLIDTAPGVAEGVGEEVRHSLAGTRVPMDVVTGEEDAAVEGADIVLVTAGAPRGPDMATRTDLVAQNARVMHQIAEAVVPRNPFALYVVVTNPVDAMATLFQQISGAEWVISTGTNLDSMRFRSELAKWLGAPINTVSGFVGGEHGDAAVFLWSTGRVGGLRLEECLEARTMVLEKGDIEESVKAVSRMIIKNTGGTRLGPAISFRDILRSVALDENRVLAVAAPYRAPGVPEPVMVGIPQMVGRSRGPTIAGSLTPDERADLGKAAQKIYETYHQALRAL